MRRRKRTIRRVGDTWESEKNRNRHAVIYALIDPRDGRIYYVGSSFSLEKRLHAHISQAKTNGMTSIKEKWFMGLVEDGLEPFAVVLENTDGKSRKKREFYWTARLMKLGAPLTNGFSGPNVQY